MAPEMTQLHDKYFQHEICLAQNCLSYGEKNRKKQPNKFKSVSSGNPALQKFITETSSQVTQSVGTEIQH
jgi:hypothetical protein